jgi:hypothetical protein
MRVVRRKASVARILKAAAAAAILAGSVLAGHAQTRTSSENDRAAAASVIAPGQVRASKLLGSAVYNSRDTKIGTVKELILNKSGTVTAVIVDVAFVGFGDKYIAVKLSDLNFGNGRVSLDRTSDQLQQMASYKLEIEDGGTSKVHPKPGNRLIIAPSQ